MHKVLIGAVCLLVACERTALSPVEIKLDNELGGFATANSINNTYTVQAGETLFDIANKFNIDPMNLAKINNIRTPYNVHNGQVLKLPVEGETVSADQQQNALYAPVDLRGASYQDTKELDDKFEKMMKVDAAVSSSAKAKDRLGQADKGFDQQAKDLSAPKITSTATGAKIKEKAPTSVKPTTAASGKMVRPVEGKVVSRFGDNLDGIPNDGINIKAKAGTSVKSVSDGEVLYAGNNLDESFGNVVVVEHKDGLVSSYAHLKDISVKKGTKIKAGQKIGSVGKTGDVSQPQLHLEIMKNNTPENPEKYLGKI